MEMLLTLNGKGENKKRRGKTRVEISRVIYCLFSVFMHSHRAKTSVRGKRNENRRKKREEEAWTKDIWVLSA